jgi:hypothetical protein
MMEIHDTHERVEGGHVACHAAGAQKNCESNAHGAMERLVSFTLQDANEVR